MANCAGLPAARIGIASPPFGLGECLAAGSPRSVEANDDSASQTWLSGNRVLVREAVNGAAAPWGVRPCWVVTGQGTSGKRGKPLPRSTPVEAVRWHGHQCKASLYGAMRLAASVSLQHCLGEDCLAIGMLWR